MYKPIKKNNFVDVPRKIAKDIVNSLSNKYKVLTNDEKSIEFSKYRKLFEKSKICIACWGFGEWVHMDAYAMYAGVILIKPYTDHVLMYPDIYKSGETYIACKHDYSDLKSIITDVLTNYDKYKEMLIRNRKMLLEIDEKHCVELFWKKVISYA